MQPHIALENDLIRADFINGINDMAHSETQLVGGQGIFGEDGCALFSQGVPFQKQLPVVQSGWNPYLWSPNIVDVSVANQNASVTTVRTVDNCAIMLGRTPYDFGTLSANQNQVLSGFVFAIIQHPVWGTNYYDVSAVLSCGQNFSVLEQIDNNFSILPLYYVNSNGVEKDYRGIPTLTMYA